ncbi:MAG: SusC/RagA family TonB-linked outer membrane protein, partial [Chitinophagaceae bacterium]|nr:SusC/RagA family TonB-linked outer membrane protein [Chitinophagaceae bacterium]
MRMTTFFMVVFFSHVAARTSSQQISLSFKNASLKEILASVKAQSGYAFLYDESLLNNTRPVSVELSNVSLNKALSTSLKGQDLDFSLSDKIIVLVRNTPNAKPLPEAPIAAPPVSGTVLGPDGSALSGVSVTVRGSGTGTSTNESGNFTLRSLADNDILVISSQGYETVMVTVSDLLNASSKLAAKGVKIRKESNGSLFLTISMRTASSSMDEVVITGYQNKNKTDYAGSVATVKAKDINVASIGTLDKMLQGQVAGVTVETSSAVFGTAPKIRVRGSSSLSGINEPLWVLDGVPLESPLNIAPSELYSGGARNLLASALSGVNPEDIDDITVLKDATATAMYGTRAVNGVIVITTKRAKKNMPLTVNYSGNVTLTLKPSITNFDVLNSLDQTILNQQIFDAYQNALQSFSAEASGAYSKLLYQRNVKEYTDEQFRNRVRDLKTVNTDWFDYLYKNSFLQQHSISASYGGEKAYGRVSLSYYDDMGKTVGESVERYTVNLNSGYQLTKRLSADLMIKYSSRDQRNAGTQVNPFIYARDASRNMRPYDENGQPEYYKKGYSDFNILEEIDNNYIRLNNYDLLAQIDLKYKISDNLKVSGLFNTRVAKNEVNEIQTEFSNYAKQFRQRGIIDPNGFFLSIDDRNKRLYKNPDLDLTSATVSVLPQGGILDADTTTSRFYTSRVQVEWNALNNKNGHSITALAGGEITSNQQDGYFKRLYGYLGDTAVTDPLAIQRLIEGTGLPEDERRQYNGRNLLEGTDNYFTEYNRHTVSYYGNLSYDYKSKYILDFSLRNDAANLTLSKFTPTWAIGGAWNMSSEPFMKSIGQRISNIKLRASYGLRGNDGARGPALVAYLGNLNRVDR